MTSLRVRPSRTTDACRTDVQDHLTRTGLRTRLLDEVNLLVLAFEEKEAKKGGGAREQGASVVWDTERIRTHL